MAITGGDGSIILKTAVDTAGLSKGLKNINGFAKTTAKGILLISGAISAVTGLAVSAYAKFEQLAGGTELLFGKASETVMKNAKEAYKTVQMSQNEYLKQVNGFAVGLKVSLGGNEQAAEYLAHKIVVAEADIIAATGNSQEAIQNAFNGIMKSNYMMLDNLQLGITPTKEGFQEVIDKVNAWNTANGKATKYQMGNLADMQSALVDYVEMQGMAGYASREAASTIQGSTAMMKASWENLLIAMSTGEGLEDAVDAFVFSLERVVSNIAPVIERTIYGLAQAVQRALPQLVQIVTTALVQQIPNLVVAVYNMIVGLFKGIVLGIKALFTGGTSKATETINNNIETGASGAGEMADNMNATAEATKDAGKEAKKALSVFDDLNILSSGASADKPTTNNMSVPNMTAQTGDTQEIQDFTQPIEQQLNAIMQIVGPVLLAIGILLLFLGNIPWGIGFIIAGAVVFSVTVATISQGPDVATIQAQLQELEGIVAVVLIALGIILLFMGQIGWGIGFIVGGAVLYAVSKFTQSDTDIDETSLARLQQIEKAVAGIFVALGIILLFLGQLPWGIGFIITGAVLVTVDTAKDMGKKK